MATVGLRYFNVFGARQDPAGDYAAVIPRWIVAMLRGAPVTIHGDGSTTRDFCPVANVVQANLLAATTTRTEALNEVYNVGVGERMSLLDLFATLRGLVAERRPGLSVPDPVHEDFRAGDVRHSQADIAKARRLLGYVPAQDARAGLRETLAWYDARAASGSAKS
jgi:UDP-N-acetylglucosamine 4-epimerase